jgi:hypothetical protein
MQSSAAQKNESGEGQDLRLYQKAAEIAYQYAKNKTDQEKKSDSFEQNTDEEESPK